MADIKDYKMPSYSGAATIFQDDTESITTIRICDLDDFDGHTFRVQKDADMAQLVESIKTNGVLNPIIVRQKSDYRYEIVAGHRRTTACKELGITTIPAVVKEYDDDEAIIAMVDSNLQRTKLLPSEKARSYKLRLEAMKRQAGRPKNNSAQVGPNYRSDTELAKLANESATQIKRYIRLTYLIGELLELVDEEKIKIIPAVELSFLNSETQISLYDAMLHKNRKSVSLKEAKTLRSAAEGKYLTIDEVISVLWPEKTAPDPKDTEEDEEPTEEESKDNLPKIPSHLLHYFASGISTELMWQKIERLLKDDAELKEAGIDLD